MPLHVESKRMDSCLDLGRIGGAMVDRPGRALIAAGWQDISTAFHRIHPRTRQYCTESETILAAGVEPGTFRLCVCSKGMPNGTTLIMPGCKQGGSLILGQFFIEDDIALESIPGADVFLAASTPGTCPTGPNKVWRAAACRREI